MARARPLAPDERRQQLLDAARICFARRGYHATSVADVIAQAGVARGTFYNYFISKRAVLQAVLEVLMEEVASAAHPIDVHGDIAAQTRANVERVVRAAVAPSITRLLFSDAVGIDAESDEALRAFYGQALGRIEKALRTGQTLGIVRAGDMGIAAQCVLGCLKEPLFQAALSREPLDPTRVADEVFALLLGGVLR